MKRAQVEEILFVLYLIAASVAGPKWLKVMCYAAAAACFITAWMYAYIDRKKAKK